MSPAIDPPDSSYVAIGDSDVAYKVLGDGPLGGVGARKGRTGEAARAGGLAVAGAVMHRS
jgi:hypothetical protein